MKILHIMGSADVGGVAAVVYNYMCYMDQDSYQFDIALKGHKPGVMGVKMMERGARFYELPLKSKGIKEYQKELFELLHNEEYDAIHVHESSTSYVSLEVAKKCGIKCRIAHAHKTGYATSLSDRIVLLSGRILNALFATTLIGCGIESGNDIFGKLNMMKKGIVLPNSINVERFCFDQCVRDVIRKEWNAENRYVIGMVGRLTDQKNPMFALEIIRDLREYLDDFLFVMVGTGDLEKEIKEYCQKNKLEKCVRLLGVRTDIDRIYQGLDICIMPSLFEGFPVVAVEAMASGLPLLLSSSITFELKFGKHVVYLPLDKEKWIDVLKKRLVNDHREMGSLEVKNNGYDIRDTVRLLEKIYEKGCP